MSAESADNLKQRADLLIELRRWREAIPLLRNALTHAPEDAHLLCSLALAYSQLEDWQNSLRYAERAIAADPSYWGGHYLRSCALTYRLQLWRALAAAREAVRLAPEEPTAVEGLAKCLLVCLRWREAAYVAEQLLALAPESADSYTTMARVYVLRRRWKLAESYSRQAAAIDPEDADAVYWLAEAVMGQGRRREAMEYYKRAAALNPEHFNAGDMSQGKDNLLFINTVLTVLLLGLLLGLLFLAPRNKRPKTQVYGEDQIIEKEKRPITTNSLHRDI